MTQPIAFDTRRYLDSVAARELPLGVPLTHRAVTDSTNDDALEAARDGAPHGALFIADEQRRGRGRRGSVWLATPGASLAFSVLLRSRVPAERAGWFALLSGLALRRAVERVLTLSGGTGAVSVKWPNDVLGGGKKLAGILVESRVQAAELSAVVIGIGLNLGSVDLPADVAERATSLTRLGVVNPERETLLVTILEELAKRLPLLEESGQTGLNQLHDELERYDWLRGRSLRIDELRGVGAGIDASGNLTVEDDLGVRHVRSAGHVEILGDASAP
jgi:BirA family biotin operon repressor/biotin-[acetyl-CoA-carboxylase] ligase